MNVGMFRGKDHFPNEVIDKALDAAMVGVIVVGTAFTLASLGKHVLDAHIKAPAINTQDSKQSAPRP